MNRIINDFDRIISEKCLTSIHNFPKLQYVKMQIYIENIYSRGTNGTVDITCHLQKKKKSQLYGLFGKINGIIWKLFSYPLACIYIYTHIYFVMSCRCKYRHVHFRQWTAGNSDDASRACTFVSTNALAIRHFYPLPSCSFGLLFLSNARPVFSGMRAFPQVRMYDTHAHPHFESPLTHRGDISWNYGDSSRRSICHGFNVGLILLRLLDVTISFVQPRRARYPATGIGLRPKIRRSPVTGYWTTAKFGFSLSILARIATRDVDEY